MTASAASHPRGRAERAKKLRAFVRRILREWKDGRPAEQCLADLERRFATEGDER